MKKHVSVKDALFLIGAWSMIFSILGLSVLFLFLTQVLGFDEKNVSSFLAVVWFSCIIISVATMILWAVYDILSNFASKWFCSTRILMRKLSDRQKIFLGLTFTSLVLLVCAIINSFESRHGFPNGYYVFLRIVTFGSLIGLMLEKFPTWAKFIFILLAILYNPVIQIHIGERETWALFNMLTVPVLIVPWIVIMKRLAK